MPSALTAWATVVGKGQFLLTDVAVAACAVIDSTESIIVKRHYCSKSLGMFDNVDNIFDLECNLARSCSNHCNGGTPPYCAQSRQPCCNYCNTIHHNSSCGRVNRHSPQVESMPRSVSL